jgi:hypothetical protein
MTSSAIMLMIMAQQRANAARRAMIKMDPQMPSAARQVLRNRLNAQLRSALAEAQRYADQALRDMEQGRRTGDILALVNVPEEE